MGRSGPPLLGIQVGAGYNGVRQCCLVVRPGVLRSQASSFRVVLTALHSGTKARDDYFLSIFLLCLWKLSITLVFAFLFSAQSFYSACGSQPCLHIGVCWVALEKVMSKAFVLLPEILVISFWKQPGDWDF